MNNTLNNLLEELESDLISLRSFISKVKHDDELIQEIKDKTKFLDIYDNVDTLERLYYIINNIQEVVTCKYCNKKAKWSGRISDGYKLTCCDKECESKRISEMKSGSNIVSINRDNKFIEWQNNVSYIDDDIIKENIKYDRCIDLLTNNYIIGYLQNRFIDSSSLLESYQRIKLGVKLKPKCPICGKPVNWVGKQSKLFTMYCSKECSGKSKETISKKKETQLKNWGSENCYDSDKYKEQYKEKYGVEYSWQRVDIKEKRKKTLLEKNGVDSPNKNKETINKNIEVINDGYIISEKLSETDNINNWLTELGYNFERQYKSDVYPFNCDFYLKDYDIYLEYRGSKLHNYKAYLGNKEDKEELEKLNNIVNESINEGINNPYTKSVIETWSVEDVNKRKYAYKHNINLLEIYYCKSKGDLKKQLDFYINCLTNKRIFNFTDDILNNEFNYYKKLYVTDINNISATYNHNNIIKYFNGNNFYKEELSIYAHNPILRRKLIQNRIKYLSKKENELTENILMIGFKISAIHYGYSHFNPQWVNWFVNKYNIKSIYDPCGGWGHHLLGMLNCEKIIYNDLSYNTYKGVCDIKDYFNLDNLICINDNACEFIPDNVDAFFMCPPYYNLEKYECDNYEDGFKNINGYKVFLNSIFNIWKSNESKIFGVILRDDFIDLIDYKYVEKYEISVSTSHLIKNKGKKYKEYFYIFKK